MGTVRGTVLGTGTVRVRYGYGTWVRYIGNIGMVHGYCKTVRWVWSGGINDTRARYGGVKYGDKFMRMVWGLYGDAVGRYIHRFCILLHSLCTRKHARNKTR